MTPNRDLTAILAIIATSRSLRAVVRDPVVRLWVQLDYLGEPEARCLVDGRPVTVPRDVTGALRVVARLIRSRGIAVSAVAHHLAADRPEHAALIDDALLATVDDGITLAAVEAARATWPQVPHVACFGTEPDIEAMMDHQTRALLRRRAARDQDTRTEEMLADPPGYFARARERARAEVERDIATAAGRLHP